MYYQYRYRVEFEKYEHLNTQCILFSFFQHNVWRLVIISGTIKNLDGFHRPLPYGLRHFNKLNSALHSVLRNKNRFFFRRHIYVIRNSFMGSSIVHVFRIQALFGNVLCWIGFTSTKGEIRSRCSLALFRSRVDWVLV